MQIAHNNTLKPHLCHAKVVREAPRRGVICNVSRSKFAFYYYSCTCNAAIVFFSVASRSASQPASTTTSHGSGSNIATAVAELNLCDIGLAADSGIAYGNIGTQRLHRSARYLLNLKTVLDATAFGCFARALPFTVQLKYYYFLFNFCVCKKTTCCGAP